MATEITDPRILGQLGISGGTPSAAPSIVVGKPEDRPTPRTPAQAAVDAANAQYAGVSPNLQAKSAFKSEQAVKAYEASMPIYKSALGTRPNKSGDNQLITYAAKLSDPTTGVLGQERENYAAAANAAERIQILINNEIKPVFDANGNAVSGTMTPQSRTRLRNELTRLMLSRNEAYNFVREDYYNTAKQLNLDPTVVVGRHFGDKFRPFLRQYDADLGIVSANVVPPKVAPAAGGSQAYRFSPEREQQIAEYVSGEKFTPQGYADLVSVAAREAGVNVDDRYRELSIAEGQRLAKAKSEGALITGKINYQKADESYAKQLDEYNRRQAEMEAGTIRASLFGQESPYAKRFAAGTGLADEAAGLGAGIGAVLQGREFSPAYQMARDAATRQVQQLRQEQGALGTLAEVAGGVGAASVPAGAISRARTLSQLSPVARAVLGETAAGATLGALEAAPDQRLRGALVGGSLAPAFAATGQVGQRVANRIISGLPAEAAPMSRQLMREGITPTPGQIGQETGGVFGTQISKLEQAATSVPVLGPTISTRRNEAITDANLAAARRAVADIQGAPEKLTETGLALRDQIELITADAYREALNPMRLKADTAFNRQKKAITSRLAKIGPDASEPMKAVKSIWETRVQPFIGTNGEITGEGLQAIKQGIVAERALLKAKAGGKQATDILDDLDDAIFNGLAKRQAPDLYDAYQNADKAFRNSKIVTKAITAAERTPGSPGIFTPSQLASQVIASERKYGPSALGGSGGLSEAMTTVLPQTLADTGTASRGAMLAAFGGPGTLGGALGAAIGGPVGALIGTGAGLGAAGLAALPYSRVGNKMIAKTLLSERPAPVTALSNYLSSNPQLVRSVGLSTGLDYLSPEQNFSNRPALLTPEQQALINVYAGGR